MQAIALRTVRMLRLAQKQTIKGIDMTIRKPDGDCFEMRHVSAASVARVAKKDVKKETTITSIDPLSAIPDLLHITFSEPRDKNCIDVVFVNEEGEHLTDSTGALLKSGGVPKTARMPKGKFGHCILFGKKKTFLVMCVGMASMRVLGGRITRILKEHDFAVARIHMDAFLQIKKCDRAERFQAFLHGLQTPTYSFNLKTKSKKERSLKIVYCRGDIGISTKKAKEISDFVATLVKAEHFSRILIDLPPQKGYMSTVDLVNQARRVAALPSCAPVETLEIIEGEMLPEYGLHMLWNVGKGRTDSPPALVVLSYQGGGEEKPTIAIVGKGLVFDTGGENIKTSDMWDMKCDMSGAAMALATLFLAKSMNAKVNIVVTLAIADNSVSGSSYHPSSVLISLRRKTVDVLDTDAEGRLALANAVEYTEEHYKPDYLITLATLTGACVVALGNDFAGLFVKNNKDKLLEVIKAASEKTWNKVWHMPLSEATHTQLKQSHIADITNLGERWGGAITGAKFILEEFTQTEHAAHIDVAGVAAEAFDATGMKAPFATGWCPALLWEVVHALSSERVRKSSK